LLFLILYEILFICKAHIVSAHIVYAYYNGKITHFCGSSQIFEKKCEGKVQCAHILKRACANTAKSIRKTLWMGISTINH